VYICLELDCLSLEPVLGSSDIGFCLYYARYYYAKGLNDYLCPDSLDLINSLHYSKLNFVHLDVRSVVYYKSDSRRK